MLVPVLGVVDLTICAFTIHREVSDPLLACGVQAHLDIKSSRHGLEYHVKCRYLIDSACMCLHGMVDRKRSRMEE